MKNLVKKLDELKEKNFKVQGGIQRAVYQLGPHELKLRIYRWDNLSLAIDADCAVWYFVNREMSIEEMILGNEHETVSYWFGTSDEELISIEEFIGGFVTDRDLVNYLVHDEYVLKGELAISKLANGEVLYRWDNMVYGVGNVGEAGWFLVRKHNDAIVTGCLYACSLSCEESEGIEQCARMYIDDEDIIQAIVHKDLVIRRKSNKYE